MAASLKELALEALTVLFGFCSVIFGILSFVLPYYVILSSGLGISITRDYSLIRLQSTVSSNGVTTEEVTKWTDAGSSQSHEASLFKTSLALAVTGFALSVVFVKIAAFRLVDTRYCICFVPFRKYVYTAGFHVVSIDVPLAAAALYCAAAFNFQANLLAAFSSDSPSAGCYEFGCSSFTGSNSVLGTSSSWDGGDGFRLGIAAFVMAALSAFASVILAFYDDRHKETRQTLGQA